jgi:hypothetical protein
MNAFLSVFPRLGERACVRIGIILIGAVLTAQSADNSGKKESAADKAQSKSKSNLQQIIFEEERIEGKIRRPQMVLIKADERPAFQSMVLTNLGRNASIAEFVDPSVIEKTPNQGAFQFAGNRISNLVK